MTLEERFDRIFELIPTKRTLVSVSYPRWSWFENTRSGLHSPDLQDVVDSSEDGDVIRVVRDNAPTTMGLEVERRTQSPSTRTSR